MTSGSMTIPRAMPPASPENPNLVTQTTYTKAPVTMVGMPVRTSVKKRTRLTDQPRPTSTRYRAAAMPVGMDTRHAMPTTMKLPTIPL